MGYLGVEPGPLDAVGKLHQAPGVPAHSNGAILDVDVENLVEPIHRYDDAAFDRNSPPGEARARPTAHERGLDVAQTRTPSDTSSVEPRSTTASGGPLKQESGAARYAGRLQRGAPCNRVKNLAWLRAH